MGEGGPDHEGGPATCGPWRCPGVGQREQGRLRPHPLRPGLRRSIPDGVLPAKPAGTVRSGYGLLPGGMAIAAGARCGGLQLGELAAARCACAIPRHMPMHCCVRQTSVDTSLHALPVGVGYKRDHINIELDPLRDPNHD